MFALVLRKKKPDLCASFNRRPGAASASRMAEFCRMGRRFCVVRTVRRNLPSLLVVLSHKEIGFFKFFKELWEADQREKLDASE